MKLKNAKVGLRVQMKSTGSRVPVGSVGTITQATGEGACVYWDDYVGGWSDPDHNIPNGHGWAVPIKDLRKVKE